MKRDITTDSNAIQGIVKITLTNYIPKARNTDQFLNSYDMLNLNQENSNNLIRPVVSNKVEAGIEVIPIKKNQELVSFTTEFYESVKEDLISTLFKLFQTAKLSSSFHRINITLITNPNKVSIKRKLTPTSLLNTNPKYLQNKCKYTL